MRGTEQKVNDESIEDSLVDLANYCIMELVEIRKEQPTKIYKPCELIPVSQDWKIARNQREEIIKQMDKCLDDIEYVGSDGKTKKLGLG